MSDETETARLQRELGRAYRAIRGLYTAARQGRVPDNTMLAYHSPTIGAACRFVETGSLEGADFFVGKPVEVLHRSLAAKRIEQP